MNAPMNCPRLAGFGLTLAAVMTPMVALAEGDAGHGEFHLIDMAPTFVNFAILLMVFTHLFRDSIRKFLRERQSGVKTAIEEATEVKAAAEAKQEEYSARLASLDDELEKLRKDMLQAGKVERDRIIKDAEEKAARMRTDATLLIEQQARQLRVELTREAVDAAVAAAEDILLKSTTPHDQQRLAQEYLGALQQPATPAAKTGQVQQETRA